MQTSLVGHLYLPALKQQLAAKERSLVITNVMYPKRPNEPETTTPHSEAIISRPELPI